MRTGVVALALAVLVLAPLRPASAQLSFDARRVGMGGVSLSRDGNARRYNPAYRAVKNKNQVAGAPKFSIPIPLGLIQFFKDHPINQLSHDPMFSPDSAAFNPIGLLDLVFNPPIFLEVKKAPTPTNDVAFTIGRNQLIVDLGASRVLIPEQDFGLGSTSRLFASRTNACSPDRPVDAASVSTVASSDAAIPISRAYGGGLRSGLDVF